MSKPLALPWDVNDCGLIFGQAPDDDAEAPLIADSAADPLAASLGCLDPVERDRARFIVRACNAHLALVEALEQLRSYCRAALDDEPARPEQGFATMLDIVDRALRKAGGA